MSLFNEVVIRCIQWSNLKELINYNREKRTNSNSHHSSGLCIEHENLVLKTSILIITVRINEWIEVSTIDNSKGASINKFELFISIVA